MELGWIDFSKSERSKVLSVLDLLSESGTLDELGIAAVRDGFSNLFFPGTSTIQTRAKYFFAVPYALKQLEKSNETNPNKVLKTLDTIERTCGEILFSQNRNESGLIGKNSLQNGNWVKRTPASIYWAGLRRYGIFTGGSLSLSEYVRVSCALKSQKATLKKLGNRNDNAEENECDDKNAGDLFKMQFWKMPLYSDKWMENLSIDLTKAEAEFLQEQIIENCKGSLLACVLEMGITEFLDCESFRDLGAIIDKFPEAVQQDYWLALAFSDFIYVIRTVYNIIISDGQNEAANDELERLKPELKELADIDVDFILNKLEVFTNPLLKKFLKQSQELMIVGDIEGLKGKIADKLVKYETTTSGVQDKRWYYIAPLLLDGAGYVTTWLNSDSELTSYDDEDEKTKRQKGFLTHLQALKELYYETDYGRKCNLGKKPDDLLDVLTDMAIASPAIVINRTYQTYCKKGESFPSFLPSQIAKIFINRMNTAESTATVELACGKKSDDAHWQNLLTYCKQGNLQAMFDEYAHLIANGFDADNNLVGNLHHSIATSMDVRTTIYTVDTFNSFKARVNGGKEKATALRSHFAVAFTKGDGKEKDADRKKVIRNAFNSPFRPFVLASTSIGQEGLDFHNYCRRIVHWNLPSNPIDLEQREGRINRFECLAIRQNIAKRYGTVSFKKNIWKEMFDEAAKVENDGEGSDLIPFWGLTEKEDMVRIERIVPMYPFSRDELAYERLIKILSLYRLTLGQARQEELLEYIFKNCDDLDEMKNYFINLSPYYKKH